MGEHALVQLLEGHFRCDECGMFFATGSEHTWFAKYEASEADLAEARRQLEEVRESFASARQQQINLALKTSELEQQIASWQRSYALVSAQVNGHVNKNAQLEQQLAASQQRERVETARLDYLIEHFIDFAVQPSVVEFREDIDKMMKQDEALRALPEGEP